MTTVGSLIPATDYNNIQTQVQTILGIGSGQNGYGQSVTSSQVSTGNTITAVQWANLKLDILKIANHQGTQSNPVISSLPTITSGTTIQASQATAFSNSIPVLQTNKFALAEFSDELLVPTVDSTRTANWNTTVRLFFTVSFSSVNNARFFFNAGGSIRIIPGFVKSSSTSINNSWDTLLNTIGTISFNHTQTTASGPSPGSGSSIGFYDLTNTFQQIYTKTASVYTENDYTIRARCNVANNTNGGATQVLFEVYFNDNKTGNIDENVTGTLTNNVRMHRPSGSNVNVIAPTSTTTVRLDAAQTPSPIVPPIISLDSTYCISVIDESSPTATQIQNDWNTFRSRYPNRQFALLQPSGQPQFALKIPGNYDGTVISNITRDNGNVGNRMDWFALLGLSSLPTGRVVSIAVDVSGSMTLDDVIASYDFFKTRVLSAGLQLVEATFTTERWAPPHDKLMPSQPV
jgi:hypothetical protein